MIKCSCGKPTCPNNIRFNTDDDICEVWIIHAKCGEVMMYMGAKELYQLAEEAVAAARQLGWVCLEPN